MDTLPGEGLPPGWAATYLGDVVDAPRTRVAADPASSLPFVGLEHIAPNALRPHAFGRFADMRSAASPFSDGDVLYARMRPYLNKVWRADRDGVASAEFIVFPQCDRVVPDFLALLLHHRPFVEFARHASSGDRPRVEWNDLARFPLWLPPLAEQTRIVAAVNALFEEVEVGEAALARAREGLTQFRASLLHAACTGALTADWRAANPTGIPPKQLLVDIAAERARKVAKRYRDAETPEGPPPFDLPRSWGWATMDQLCWQIDYGSSARCRPMPDGVPVLRMGNIQAGRLDYTDLKHLPRDHDEFPGLLLEPGDLLFNRTNSAELVGKTAVFGGHDRPVSFASYIVRAKVVQVRPQFLAHYINSPLGRQWIASVMTQQVGQANVSGGRLRTLCVPVPPLPEQDEIVTRVANSLDVARDAALGGSGVEQAAQLRQSILHAAFTGRLVPQAPGDEPAAALLARLRATPATPRRTRQRRAAAQPDLIETTP